MTQKIAGPGMGLPLPQNLYPSELLNAPYDAPTNWLTLNAGDSFVVPAGEWWIDGGMYCIVQYLDPLTQVWQMGVAPGWTGGPRLIVSDGFSVRVANLLGCPVDAVVAALGSAYVQSSTTITPTPGNSTWLPIIGGALALSGATLTSSGAGYGVAPIVLIPPPPPAANNPNGVGGIQASGYCVIASGTISGFTFTNPGAGYPTAPVPVIVPSPFDPNLSAGVTNGTMAFTLANAGALTGALCTNSGVPLANPANITLTIGGAGSGASLSAVVLQTITVASIAGGTGYGNAIPALITTVGGVPAQGSIANQFSLFLAYRPRPAQISATPAAGGTFTNGPATIIDGGLFAGTPTAVTALNVVPTTLGTITITMGNRPDSFRLQPAA